ncbi:Translationally-controlled tumor protein [Terramyces sp. JEL0728]|nr:Translationally-controlled tumor protein [Terramyces sp. JEL0728]KAJ3269699.1 Translationally-controlled tumor protein [Terramyces sp. JEL0728]
MIIYKDIISGDEMASDAFEIREIDDIAIEIDCKNITVMPGADVDIGANASAEEQEEQLEDGAVTVNNVVYTFRLSETSFDKKSYMSYIKGYMKTIKAHLQEHNPDRVATFEANAPAFVKKILGNIKDYEFFVGESMDPEGAVGLLNYREDGITPYITYFKDGLKTEKV